MFDWFFYINYHDLKLANINTPQKAYEHWKNHGQFEKRKCISNISTLYNDYKLENYLFDSYFYLNYYKDLQKNNIKTSLEAWNHWINYGKKEGRIYNEIYLKPSNYKLNNTVDKIYLINLEKDKDRLNIFRLNSTIFDFKYQKIDAVDANSPLYKNEFEIFLEKNKIIDDEKITYENFDYITYLNNYQDLVKAGIKTKQEAYEHWVNYGKNKENRSLSKTTKIKSKGEWGCLYSHCNILKDALLNKYKNILIFEDDVYFNNIFNEKLFKILDIYKNYSWKIIYLGSYQIESDNPIKKHENFYYADNSHSTFAYIVNCNFIKELLDEYEKFTDLADKVLVNLQKKYPKDFFVIYPNIVASDLSTSNITKNIKKYNKIEFPKTAWYFENYFTFKLHNDINYFEQLVSNKRIIIVGPADYVNNGKEIDKYDIIIRMNRGHNQIKDYKKYGSRTDILYHCINQDDEHGGQITLMMLNDIKHIRGCYPPILFHEKTSFYQESTIYLYNKLPNIKSFSYVDKDEYLKFEKELKCRPNCGTVAIWDILKYDFKELYITGFTLFKTNFAQLYRDKTGKMTIEMMKGVGNHKQELIKEYYKETLLGKKNIKLDDILINLLHE